MFKIGKLNLKISTIFTQGKGLSLRVRGTLLSLFRKVFRLFRDRPTPWFKLWRARSRPAEKKGLAKAGGIKARRFLKGKVVLGLDIGVSSVKAARLLQTRRGVRLLNFWEKEVPREGRGEAEEEVIDRAIAELLSQIYPASLQKGGAKEGKERIISSLPTSSSIIKRLSLPFKGEGRIRQVIKYEMEPHLPFPLDEAIIDFCIIDDRFPDRTLVLAFAFHRRIIERHLRILHRAGVKPEVVDLDSSSLFNIYLSNGKSKTIALIDLGAGQTIVNVISEERLFFTRSFSRAGDDITQALAEGFGVSFKKAEKLKREGLDETRLKAIEPVLGEIRKGIEHTFSSFLAYHPQKRIEKILLTGGSARLPGIAEYLQKNLAIETSLFNPFQEPSPTKLSLSGLKEFFFPPLKEISALLNKETLDLVIPLLPQVMGVALRGVTKTRISCNFIQEERPLVERLEEARPLLEHLAIFLISVLLLALLDFYLHFYLKVRKRDRLKVEIQSVFKKTFPEVTNIVDPLIQMKSGLEKREEDLALSPRAFSPLSILREISFLTPEELGIALEDLSVDWNGTRIRGRTDSADFSLVDRFKQVLESSDYFSEVKVSDAHLSRGGGSVEFRMTIKYGDER